MGLKTYHIKDKNVLVKHWVLTLNVVVMKKVIYAIILSCSITIMASCDYDDSNDIDILTPNDTTETAGAVIKKLPA